MRYLGFNLRNPLFVAPMAGVTDRPFRQLCKRLGAGLAVSEMVTSNSLLYGSAKTLRRANHDGENAPIVVQIAGADPTMMANAAKYNVERGAQIIDINMGCPAKKVCNVMAGSALMQNPTLVQTILQAVRDAVQVPVTLKMRTGWNRQNKNAPELALLAQSIGINAITIHGRTRADLYNGTAEYETIREIKRAVNIPVIANGDIDSPEKAEQVLQATGADALMIGRAAQGRPWIFAEIEHYLRHHTFLPPPSPQTICGWLNEHLDDLYAFYGNTTGVKIARKHIGWYTYGFWGSAEFRFQMNRIESPQEQRQWVIAFFERAEHHASINRQAPRFEIAEECLAAS